MLFCKQISKAYMDSLCQLKSLVEGAMNTVIEPKRLFLETTGHLLGCANQGANENSSSLLVEKN